jgi:hypothetical protein
MHTAGLAILRTACAVGELQHPEPEVPPPAPEFPSEPPPVEIPAPSPEAPPQPEPEIPPEIPWEGADRREQAAEVRRTEDVLQDEFAT